VVLADDSQALDYNLILEAGVQVANLSGEGVDVDIFFAVFESAIERVFAFALQLRFLFAHDINVSRRLHCGFNKFG